MRVWKLNLYDKYFGDIKKGLKTFEIRRNKRKFKIGDIIEFNNLKTKEKIRCKIKYINYSKEIYSDTDLVIMGLSKK